MEDFGDIIFILLFVAGSIISAVAKAFKKGSGKKASPASGTAPVPSEDPFDFESFKEDVLNRNVVKEPVKEQTLESEIMNDSIVDHSKYEEKNKTDYYSLNRKKRRHPILRKFNLSDAIIYSEILKPKF